MNFSAQLVGNILVCVHNERTPSDAEWVDFLALWRTHRNQITGQLVFSAGGGPNPKQRAASLPVIHERAGGAPPTAVLTDSALVRGAVTAFSWVVRERIRAFGPNSLLEACRFIGAADVHALEAALATGRHAVGLPEQLRKLG